MSGAQIGLGVALISRGYGPKSNKDLLGQTLVGSGLGGLMSIDSDSPMSWKHWGDGTIVGGATAAGAALGQRYGGTKGMIKGSMLGNAAGQGLSVGLGLRDQVSVEEIAMTGVMTVAFVGVGAAASQAAKVAGRAASAAASTAAGRAVVSTAGRVGTAISEAASCGARMIGRGLKHRYGEEAISNWVHGTMGKTIFHKPLEWAGTKAGLKVCFASGTPLRTPDGSQLIETFRVGDLVLSRDEFDVNGVVEAKVVEEIFVRHGLIWNLHIGGQVIRTTAEHPFHVVDQGWTPTNELHIGDQLLCEDGTTVVVEDLLDSGEWQTVYNLRIADFHTYFVGCDEWGYSVWAHNAVCTPEDVISAVKDVRSNTRLGKVNAQRVADAINAGNIMTAKAILKDTVKGVGEKRAQVIADALGEKANLYERPYHFRSGVRDTVWDSAKGADSKVRDPQTSKVMKKDEPWDMGHEPGYEFKSHQESSRQRAITRDQFLDEYYLGSKDRHAASWKHTKSVFKTDTDIN